MELHLWRGDITTLCCDAMVNAANAALLGCFRPDHPCMTSPFTTWTVQRCATTAIGSCSCRDIPSPRASPRSRRHTTGLPSSFCTRWGRSIAVTTSSPRRLVCLAMLTPPAWISPIGSVAPAPWLFAPFPLAFWLPGQTGLSDRGEDPSPVAGQPSASLRTLIFNVFNSRDERMYEQVLQGHRHG